MGVIVCPGGSYHHLGIGGEGTEVAEWLNRNGITAFVLRYRVSMYGNHYPAPMEDLCRAMEMARSMAPELGLDAAKIGVMGFSAGGHLAGWLATYGGADGLNEIGAVARGVDLTPSFVAMIYPVVTMRDPAAHVRSRNNLIGNGPDRERLMEQLSLEEHATASMPPLFLVCARDDDNVDPRNSIEYDRQLSRAGVEHEFWLYEHSGHGFGISDCKGGNDWTERFLAWIVKNDLK